MMRALPLEAACRRAGEGRGATRSSGPGVEAGRGAVGVQRQGVSGNAMIMDGKQPVGLCGATLPRPRHPLRDLPDAGSPPALPQLAHRRR